MCNCLNSYCRRPIYIFSRPVYLIWIVFQAAVQKIEIIIVGRFLDGLSGSASIAVSGGTVRDIFNSNIIQVPILMFSVVPFVSPSVGLSMGGFIKHNVG
ncbi:unnamed protein product [Fusarium graminearum]|nr:unnamed protein product [Fusarium graminearum]CAG1990219.1 unnamed protein product [Fusarium graminearum]CAG1992144.1 unnamed protein product [Fusarium graminearum]